MAEIPSFRFYRSYFEAVKNLEPLDRDAVWMAICSYALDGVEPELSGVPAAMFILIRPNLNASKAKAESGRAGGTSKANNKQTDGKAVAKQKQTRSNKEIGVGSKEIGVGSKELGAGSGECVPLPPPKKEPKVQWADNVTMTNAEHEKLLATHGPADTKRLIEILDNYKGSTGKRYKDDYRAILSWCVDRLKEEHDRGKKNGAGGTGAPAGNSGRSQAEGSLNAIDL